MLLQRSVPVLARGFICLLALAMPPSLAQARSFAVLRIATEGARPPFNFIDGHNAPAGFDVDLGQEICARLKAKCEFVTQDWDNLIPNLLLGRYDMIISAMRITTERREKIDFSTPYANIPPAFLAQRDAAIPDVSPAGLEQKRIGVVADSPAEAYLKKFYPQSELHPYATLEEAILDLGSDRIDLVLGRREAIGDFLRTRKEGECCRIVGSADPEPAILGEGMAVGLRKTDPDLREAVNAALQNIRDDGTFARIRAKYFDYELE